MGEYYQAQKAVGQLKEIFDVASFDAEYIDNLCSEGNVFLDQETPDWKERYDHISTRYRKMIDMFRDHLGDMSEFYILKSRIECGILKEVRPNIKESA